jgi:hypothetical protein
MNYSAMHTNNENEFKHFFEIARFINIHNVESFHANGGKQAEDED